MRKELGKKYGERDLFYGTFQRFGTKSGYKQTESTVLITTIEDTDGNLMTDHLWFNYTKEFENLYKEGKLKASAILEFRARVAGYMKGYEKDEFDYKLSFPKKIKVIGWDPDWINEVTGEPIPIPEKKKSGTEELGDKNINIQKGCKYGCKFCFAFCFRHHYDHMEMEEWVEPVEYKEKKFYRKSDQIFFMFSGHDIYPENFERCKREILKVLLPGNSITFVSKMDPNIAEKLIPELEKYKDQIEFFITITSLNEDLRLKWEEGAPNYQNRLKSVHLLLKAGFKTNVLCEPMLTEPDELIEFLLNNEPNLNKIWLGAMQYRADAPKLDFQAIYEKYKDHPKFAFKDSLMKKIKEPKPMDQTEFNRLMIDWLENGYNYDGYDHVWFNDEKGIMYEGGFPDFYKKYPEFRPFKVIKSNMTNHMIRFAPKTKKEAICILKGIEYIPDPPKTEESIQNDPMKRTPKMKTLLSFIPGGSN